jgi:protein-arginine kinase activator protein McsA
MVIKMLVVRCKNCNTELSSTPQGHSCGCSNMTMVRNDTISAIDLSLVEIISGIVKKNVQTEYKYLTKEDLAWMESRKSRKVRKLDFEIR